MIKVKKLSLVLVLVSLCAWFLSGAVFAQEITIGFAMKTLTNPFFIMMEEGVRRAEKELGVKVIVQAAEEETSIEQLWRT